MIKGIILHNFQSHSHTEMEFSKGINSITGQSDNGKTAIDRAFEDCRSNTSNGLEYVSFWAKAKNKKGDYILKDDSYTTVIFWDGTKVTRKKGYSPAFNGYIINYPDGSEQIYDKIGRSGVPKEVERIFNMSEVNVQNQYDAAFLVSQNGQDVARFFNRLIKLDVADTAISTAKSRRNSTRKDVKLLEVETAELSKKISGLEWVDLSLMQIEKLQKLNDEVYEANKEIESIEDTVADIEYNQIRIDNLSYVNKVTDLMSSLDDLEEFINDRESKVDSLENMIFTLDKVTKQVESNKWVSKCTSLVDDLDTLHNWIRDTNETIENIDAMIGNIEALEIVIKKQKNELKKYEALLPKKCPTCDQFIGDKNEA